MKIFYKFWVLFGVFGLLNLIAFQVNAQMQVERLDRGAIAVRLNQGYAISWRLLADEDAQTGFNVYRNSSKLNVEPIVNVTSYIDETAPLSSSYYVKKVQNGVEQPEIKSAFVINNNEGLNAGYFDVPVSRPVAGSHGGTYNIGDASTADLNGDGQYDIVLKWDPSNAQDNSKSGVTDDVFLDGYTLDGTFLWRINLGPNIRAGAHYTQFLVYDFDGNGRAEVMCKTAPCTKDASGNFISKGPAATADHSKIYRNSSGYILTGPEYITVFDGETGLELATDDYWPARGVVSKATWGDDYGNRVDRFNAAVAYVDGQRPTAIFQRGYYTRMTFAAWDWRDGKLTKRWTFDSNTTGNGAYYGQGNHQIAIVDADGAGKHDIVTGTAVIGSHGKGIHTSGKGHGDALHVTYMKKGENRPMIFMPHENKVDGVTLRYADTGELIFQHKAGTDVGRGTTAELDPDVPGFHFWAASSLGLYNMQGEKVGSGPNSINFVIWWDGNLSRNLMNSNTIDKWSIRSNSATRLLTGNGAGSINGTKSTPVLQADLLGDWREEVILARADQAAMRVFTTLMPTSHKLYTFMHDPVYRVAVSWQNSSYNQPPHPGFYVATDMDFPVAAPHVQMLSSVYRGSSAFFKDLMVSDVAYASAWSIASNLSNNNSAYPDLSLTIKNVPDYLIGKEWIRTSANSRRWTEGQMLASFIAKRDAIISVVYAEGETPEWLSSFTKRSELITVSSPIAAAKNMVVYEKQVVAGELVVLGVNSGQGDESRPMYWVVARNLDGTSVQNVSQLEQSLRVYPNPVRNWAKIEFAIEKEQFVRIELVDESGRLVQVLSTGKLDAGSHAFDLSSEHLQNGMYMIRVKTIDQVIQKKLIVRSL